MSIVADGILEEFDIETCHKEQNKSNITKASWSGGVRLRGVRRVWWQARRAFPLERCIRAVTPTQTSPNVAVVSASTMC